jgi:hypothetical protein
MGTTNKLTQVNGQDLIVGNTYYLDKGGRDKAIFEGVVIGQYSMRCLFNSYREYPLCTI